MTHVTHLNQMSKLSAHSLVTHPMLQRQPNHTDLRSMDSYIQILCRFQKYKRKLPLPPFGVKGDFLVQGSGDSGGTFCLLFWNLHKIWI